MDLTTNFQIWDLAEIRHELSLVQLWKYTINIFFYAKGFGLCGARRLEAKGCRYEKRFKTRYWSNFEINSVRALKFGASLEVGKTRRKAAYF